ncbi:MAG: DUF559 domain-containing protein [Microbacteriaceae bacterium]|nr:DUF559 domain-containing protein [Microbacteriaceae bacterium]
MRIRRGWYRHRDVEPLAVVLRAVAAGGVLTGASALAVHGAWDLGGDLDVRAARLGLIAERAGVRRVVLPGPDARRCTAAVDALKLAFRVALRTLPERELVMVGDSLVQRGLASRATLVGLADGLGPGARTAVSRIDGRCESGTETIARLWLESHGIPHIPQHVVPGVGRIDFLIGDRLVLEVDSIAHHTGEDRYQADRTRDQLLIALGYTIVRVTYEDVMHRWPTVAKRLLAVIARGEHLRGAA